MLSIHKAVSQSNLEMWENGEVDTMKCSTVRGRVSLRTLALDDLLTRSSHFTGSCYSCLLEDSAFHFSFPFSFFLRMLTFSHGQRELLFHEPQRKGDRALQSSGFPFFKKKEKEKTLLRVRNILFITTYTNRTDMQIS